MSDPEDSSNKMSEDDQAPSTSEDKSKQKFPPKINSFLLPFFEEPQHVVLSSPFARRLMLAAAGPSKPHWYSAPIASEFLHFKYLTHLVEDGRKRPMPFMPFVEHLQKLAPTVTPNEVLGIIKRLDRDQIHELDFGEFLFLLSNNPHYDKILEATRYKAYISKHHFNPRQRVFFSALAFYCLIQTEDDIERVYRGSRVAHADVLQYHMDATRNEGLSELEMEKRQLNVRNIVKKFRGKFHSTYTAPVPFVKATANESYYKKYVNRRKRLSKMLYPSEVKKLAYHREITPIELRRQLGGPVFYKSDDDYILHLYLMASIPRPNMVVSAKRLKELRTRAYESDKLFLKTLEEEALNDYYRRLHEAAVLYGKDTLKKELRKGFPTQEEKIIYYDLYKQYMPLSTEGTFIIHPWTPMSIDAKYKRKPKTPPPFGRSAN